jgi:hypothetical protein
MDDVYDSVKIRRVLTQGDLVANQVENGLARYVVYGKKNSGLLNPLPNHQLHQVGKMRNFDDVLSTFVKAPGVPVPDLFSTGPGRNGFDPPGMTLRDVEKSTGQRLKEQMLKRVSHAKEQVRGAAGALRTGYRLQQVKSVVSLAKKASLVAEEQLAAAKGLKAIARAQKNVAVTSQVLKEALEKQTAIVAQIAVKSKSGKVFNGAGKQLSKLGKVVGRLGVATTVLQAGKIAAETIKDHHEFREKLRQGVYDEKLNERLNYAVTDALLGRGTTKAVVEACSGKGSVFNSTASCLKSAGGVAKDLGSLLKAGGVAVGRGTLNCLKAGVSREHECALKHAPKAMVSGAKKLGTAVGGWFSAQYTHHRDRWAEQRARRAHCAQNKAQCEAEEAVWKENEAKARAAYRLKKSLEKKAKREAKEAEARRRRKEFEKKKQAFVSTNPSAWERSLWHARHLFPSS